MRWIRCRTDLRTDARLTALAVHLLKDPLFGEWMTPGHGHDVLEIVPFDAVVSVALAAVLRVWGEASDSGEEVPGSDDAVLRLVQTPIQIDQIGGIPGIARAMESVGWLDWDDESHVLLPGFLKHNTLKPADPGAADRVRAWRRRQKDSSVKVPTPRAPVAPPESERNTNRNGISNPSRNSTRNRTSESESVSESTSSSGLLPKQEALSGDDRPDAPPPNPQPVLHRIEAMPDRVTPAADLLALHGEFFGQQHTPMRVIEQLEKMTADYGVDDVRAFCARRLASGERWGKVRDDYWSSKRSASAKNQSANNSASDRAKERRAAQSRREYGSDDIPMPIQRFGKSDG